jgi:paraquat-inducible protein A
MRGPILVACRDCDLVQREPEVPPGGAARCPRCRALLHRHRANSLDRTLALAIAGLVLFVVANAFPFLAFEMQGQVTRTTLASGVRSLYQQGQPAVATLVLFTAILAPLLQLLTLLAVLGPLKLGLRPRRLALVFRLLRRIQPWSMMEVFLLGILVSVAKLSAMAAIVPGLALWSFGLLIPVVAAATSSLDPRLVWSRLEARA